jgi:CDP-glucose 4,6-dehydratase
MNAKFWKSRKVLITGNEGFLGSNLTRRLISCGAKIVGLDIVAEKHDSLFTREDRARFKGVKGSVSNYGLVSKIVEEHRAQFVFHLAAEAIVAKCQKVPLKVFRSNITGTWNVLEACRAHGFVEAVLVASSDKAYGDHSKLPYTESTALKGQHPYDVSKSCADLIATTYFKSYGLPVSVVRSGNIFGPGDFNFSRIIPDCVRCAIQGREFAIRSNGKFTRDYVYVEDIVEAYLVLAEKLKSRKLGGEAFNFSNEKPMSVIEVVEKVYKMMAKPAHYQILNKADYEIKHQFLDSAKARKVLGWKPKESINTGMLKTIDWYKKYFSARLSRR